MSNIAIKATNVSKYFKLPHEKSSSIKSLIVNFWKMDRSIDTLKVLDNISFEVEEGEFFGIVGKNGSGKSTLLKIISGIYQPTLGNVDIRGKLTPFIELGVGFNPELTGRENVYLNGALLGFSRNEVEDMYDEIVHFAELKRFMDQKLKNYSSGMQVRLAFSIAIKANTDILVLDEVLAVGDEAFQKKCFAYFEELKRNKKTVILVTHDMASVERFCTRAMLIDEGEIKTIGKPHDVAAQYSRTNDEIYEAPQQIKTEKKEVKKSDLTVKLADDRGSISNKFKHGDTMTVNLSWINPNVQYVGVSILRLDGEFVYGTNTFQEKIKLTKDKTASFNVNLNLYEGDYFIVAGTFGSNDKIRIDYEENGPRFTVSRNGSVRWGGVTELDHKWNV